MRSLRSGLSEGLKPTLGRLCLFALFLGGAFVQGKGRAHWPGWGCWGWPIAWGCWPWPMFWLAFWAACWAWYWAAWACRGRHDAVIMLRMLKIILGHDAVAAGIGVAGQLQIFLIHMAGRAADLHFRAGRIVGAVGIEPAAIATTAATAAAVAIMCAACGRLCESVSLDPLPSPSGSRAPRGASCQRRHIRFALSSPARRRVFYRVAQSCGHAFHAPREGSSPIPATLNLAESRPFSKAYLQGFTQDDTAGNTRQIGCDPDNFKSWEQLFHGRVPVPSRFPAGHGRRA